MPETTYTTRTGLTPDELWAFVQDMDHWAPFLAGYQSHRKLSDTLSEWTLKGDAGPLARQVTFRVHVTEWRGPARVAFRLEGVNEDMAGGGAFEIAQDDTEVPQPGVLARLWARLVRAIFRLRAPADADGPTRVTFHLSIEPGGPMAPMISAMIAPAMLPAAQDLVQKVLDRLRE